MFFFFSPSNQCCLNKLNLVSNYRWCCDALFVERNYESSAMLSLRNKQQMSLNLLKPYTKHHPNSLGIFHYSTVVLHHTRRPLDCSRLVSSMNHSHWRRLQQLSMCKSVEKHWSFQRRAEFEEPNAWWMLSERERENKRVEVRTIILLSGASQRQLTDSSSIPISVYVLLWKREQESHHLWSISRTLLDRFIRNE